MRKNRLNFVNSVLPVGSIIWQASTNVPTGWLIANGQAVARIKYPLLFAAYGTKFGTDGTAVNFRLPNLFNTGAGLRGVVADADIGFFSGRSNISLSLLEMPLHDHGGLTNVNNADHSHSGQTAFEGEHSHGYILRDEGNNSANRRRIVGGNAAGSVATSPAGTHSHNYLTSYANLDHRHAISVVGEAAVFSCRMPTVLLTPLCKAF